MCVLSLPLPVKQVIPVALLRRGSVDGTGVAGALNFRRRAQPISSKSRKARPRVTTAEYNARALMEWSVLELGKKEA